MEFAVRYDTQQRTIYVPVHVTPPPTPAEEPGIWTPPFGIPKGDWKVVWEIDAGSVQYAAFNEPGAEKADDSVPNLQLICDPSGLTSIQCTASLINRVKGANVCGIMLSFKDPNSRNRPFKHDPTIAVTQDPLDPPRYP